MVKKDHTQEIEDLIKLTIGELESIENEAKKEKHNTIRKLAENLEKYLPTDMICGEICHQLELTHLISNSEIHRCLDDKYKQVQKKTKEKSTSHLVSDTTANEDKKVLEVTSNGNEEFVIDNTGEPPEEFKSMFESVNRSIESNKVSPEAAKHIRELENVILKQNHKYRQLELQKQPEKQLLKIFRDQYDEVKDAMRASPSGFIAIEHDGKSMLAAIDHHSAQRLLGEQTEPNVITK